MRVAIPYPLRSYTAGSAHVSAVGTSLASLLNDLDHQFPGIRFRIVDEQDQIRQHIKVFVNGEQRRDLGQSLSERDQVMIVAALSGG